MNELNRRRFHQLSAAALGGMLSGVTVGCRKGEGPAEKPGEPGEAAAAAEKHVCRGLNACKGQGADGKNACAGQGVCATAEAHSCAGQNACKGQGGCGENPGANECKGKGGCAVPLEAGMWDTARKAFEERMKAAGKQFGEAPAAPMG